jgi:hypothetical protein
MAALTKVADLRLIQESSLPYPVRRHEKVGAPTQAVQQIRYVFVSAAAAVIEGQQHWPVVSSLKFEDRYWFCNDRADRLKVAFELRDFELVNIGIRTGESAGSEVSG